MAKDTKKKKAEKKARTALKTAKKAHQKTKKQRRASISSTESEDIDTILASFQTTTTTTPTPREVKCPPPRARSATTLLPSPTSKELILFGGEFFSGERASFSNELFIYKVASRQWRRVEGDGPLPRSGHAVALLPSKGEYYLFGGEFSSSRQKAFYHYGDLWRLTARGGWAWERIGNSTAKGGAGPSARSGHRMVAYKQFVFLFGGFQDTANETKYLDDTWVFDTSTEKWWSVATQGLKPAARSSFSFLPHPEGAVLVGGYSRVKETLRGGRTTTRPLVHVDSWLLRAGGRDASLQGVQASQAPLTVKWERRKKPANAPVPPRAGATMAAHAGRGIMFGGVCDVEKSEEGIESEFFDKLYAYHVERNRFFPLQLRRGKVVRKVEAKKVGRVKANEEELLRNLAIIEGRDAEDLDMEKEEKEEEVKEEEKVVWEMPHPRFNAQLAVLDDVLYVYGGTFERGDKEFTFDEMWAIHLGRLDGWKEIFKRDIPDWDVESEDSESDEEDDEDEEEEEEKEEEEEEEEGEGAADIVEKKKPQVQDVEEAEEESSSPLKDDGKPYPKPFESLREFFSRTSNPWQEEVLDWIKYQRDPEFSVKEIRKMGFERAERRWWDCREEIQELEREQEAAGIGDVVSLEERTTGQKRR